MKEAILLLAGIALAFVGLVAFAFYTERAER